MKNEDFYDKHSDNRKSVKKHKKKFVDETLDNFTGRNQRVSFKNYVQKIEEELLLESLTEECTKVKNANCSASWR